MSFESTKEKAPSVIDIITVWVFRNATRTSFPATWPYSSKEDASYPEAFAVAFLFGSNWWISSSVYAFWDFTPSPFPQTTQEAEKANNES